MWKWFSYTESTWKWLPMHWVNVETISRSLSRRGNDFPSTESTWKSQRGNDFPCTESTWKRSLSRLGNDFPTQSTWKWDVWMHSTLTKHWREKIHQRRLKNDQCLTTEAFQEIGLQKAKQFSFKCDKNNFFPLALTKKLFQRSQATRTWQKLRFRFHGHNREQKF